MTNPMTRIGDIATIERQTVDPNSIADGSLYVGLEHIEKGGRLKHINPVSRGDLSSTKFQFTGKHVLFGKLRPNLAKVALPDFSGVCSTDILPILPGPNLDRRYLAYYLLQPKMISYASSRATGINLPRLSPGALADFEIPLPPLKEQQRIAAILDKADSLRQKRKQAIALLDSLTQSIFLEMIGSAQHSPVDIRSDEPQLPKGWNWCALTDVARLATGHTPDRKRPDYWNGDIPWISLSDIRSADGKTISETAYTVTQDGIDHSSSVILPKGTVCFSRTASVGFTCIMGRDMATSQDFVNWVCGPAILPEYLQAALNVSRTRLLSLATGSTHRTIYFPTVKKFHVLVPPMDLQKKFRQVKTRIDAQREKAAFTQLFSDNLFTSLQHHAFAGEL